MTYTKVETKSDSLMDLLEKVKSLREKDFEPHLRSPVANLMADNWYNETNREKDSTNWQRIKIK